MPTRYFSPILDTTSRIPRPAPLLPPPPPRGRKADLRQQPGHLRSCAPLARGRHTLRKHQDAPRERDPVQQYNLYTTPLSQLGGNTTRVSRVQKENK